MITAALRFCARLACRAPWIVLIISTLLAAVSIVYTSARLELNANLDDLIAPDRPFMAEYRRLLNEFGDLEHLFVVVTGDDLARREAAVDSIAQALKPLEGVPAVHHAVEGREQLRIATRAMDEADLQELAMAAGAFAALGLRPADAAVYVEDLLERLVQSSDEAQQQELAASAFFILEAMTRDELIELPEKEYLVSATGKLHFVQVQPVRDFGTMAVIEQPLRRIREVLNEARQRFPDLEIGLTGKPVLQADEMQTSDRDTTRAFVIAIILVAILFMVTIGGVWHPMLAVVSLLFGIAWTFGFTTLAVGQLTLLSVVFTLVLVGVGIDFGVHIVSRYKEQRGAANDAGSIEEAMTATLQSAGRGNLYGALTSSIAFYMAVFTEFQGLRELGFIAGTGLLLCLVAMLLVLPSLIVIVDRRSERSGRLPQALPPTSRIHRGLWNVLMARPGTWLLIALGLTLALSPWLRNLDFEKNLLELQADNLDSVQWEHRILEDSGESFFGAVIVDSEQEALQVIERAKQQPAVARAGSVFDIIQPSSDRRAALRQRLHDSPPIELPETNNMLTAEHFTPIIDRLTLIVAGARMQQVPEAEQIAQLLERVQSLQQGLASPDTAEAARSRVAARLETAAERIDLMLAGDLMSLREALPSAVRNHFVSESGRLLVSLYPVENVWEFEPMERFVAAMREIDPDATGVPITQYESLIEMLRAFVVAASLAFAAVFILLWLDLRRFSDAVLALLPLIIAMVWLVQWMAIVGIDFNHANFFAVPILIGIGVDSGIHLMHRYREAHPGRLAAGPLDAHYADTFGSTRRAVFITSMTSLIGFGALATASHRGLQSLGLVMAIGAATVMMASLLVLPALLAWLERRGRSA